jgi:hypothetical protein
MISDSQRRAKLNTRESSTLTFATVAASASLVVLAFALSGKTTCLCLGDKRFWAGFGFAVLGFAYRELTIHFSDFPDYFEMKSERPHLPTKAIFARGMIVRFVLLIPIASWGSYLCELPFHWTVCFAIAILVSLGLEYLERVRRISAYWRWPSAKRR